MNHRENEKREKEHDEENNNRMMMMVMMMRMMMDHRLILEMNHYHQNNQNHQNKLRKKKKVTLNDKLNGLNLSNINSSTQQLNEWINLLNNNDNQRFLNSFIKANGIDIIVHKMILDLGDIDIQNQNNKMYQNQIKKNHLAINDVKKANKINNKMYQKMDIIMVMMKNSKKYIQK